MSTKSADPEKKRSAPSKTPRKKRAGSEAGGSRARRNARRRRTQSEEPEEELLGVTLGIGSRVAPPPEVTPETEESTIEVPPAAAEGDVEEQIRELEARLDGMIRRTNTGQPREQPTIREQVGSAAREVVERLSVPLERAAGDNGDVVETARELFSSDYFLRQWGRIGMRNRSEEVDEFGLDPTYEQRLTPVADFLYKHYFRVSATGIENIPESGRCLLVANHSGTVPIDGAMLRTALRLEHPSGRELRWLAEDFIFYLPFVGAFMNRIGAVRACQENAERLLRTENVVAVFPEGIKGIRKLYKDRYRLQRFGRGGFIRLCLRTQTPLVPCAIVGAEETNPMLYRSEYLSKALGLPYIPITPTFPALGPLGLIPAPSKWSISFGDVMRFDGYGPEAADDHVLVGRLSERVRTAIQDMLDRSLSQRKSVWFG